MAIKKIVLSEKICERLYVAFKAAGIGWCPIAKEFITTHGRKLLIEAKDYESLVQRDTIIARVLSLALDFKLYRELPSLMQTIFRNIHGNSVCDNHQLQIMFTPEERTDAVASVMEILEYENLDDRQGGMFGRITTSYMGCGKFVTNITYNTVATEIITPDEDDELGGGATRTVIKSIDAVDFLMIEYELNLKELSLDVEADRLPNEDILSRFNIPNFGETPTYKRTGSKDITYGCAYQHWIEELCANAVTDQVHYFNVNKKDWSAFGDGPKSVALFYTSTSSEHPYSLVAIGSNYNEFNGDNYRLVRSVDGERAVFYRPACNELDGWYNQIAGFDVRIAIKPTGWVGKYDQKTMCRITMDPSSEDKQSNDAIARHIVSACAEASRRLGHEANDVSAVANPTLHLTIKSFADAWKYVSLIRDIVTSRILAEGKYVSELGRCIISKESIDSFSNVYDTQIVDNHASHDVACLRAMRGVYKLLDIPNMPGVEGEFFRKLEATICKSEAIALLQEGI